MPDDSATQGLTGTTATQGASATGKDGAGAPGDAPPAEEMFSQSRVKAIAAKEGRVGQALGRKAVLEEYGVADEAELKELIAAGRTARPKKVDDSERLAEKVRAQADAEKAQLTAQIAELKSAQEAAMVREAAKSVLMNAGLVEGGADLILATLGLGSKPEHRLVVKDGKVAVVDQDGDPTGKPVDQFLASLVKPYLRAPTGQAHATLRAGGPEPKAKPNGPQRRLTLQEQLDAAVEAGLASSGALGSGR